MFRPFTGALALAATAALSTAVVAQEEPARQILKDVWAATSQQLLEVDLDSSSLEVKSSGGTAFKAIAFEPPVLGGSGAAERGLLAVDGTLIKRFDNTSDALELTWQFNADVELSVVTGVAATDEGTVLVSGYSRRKRTYEIWELFPPGTPGGVRFEPRPTGTPQLVDIVFVPAEDVVGGALEGGGLLATAAKQVLFFSKSSNYATVQVLADAKSLALKGATDLTSVDLVRETGTLLLATTERKLLTAPASGGAPTQFASVPTIAGRNCAALKPQRFIVRSVEAGNDGASVVSDACGQVVLYDYATATPTTPLAATAALTYTSALIALAVAEGNEITCTPNVPCALISRTDPNANFDALSATINSAAESQLIVLQYPELCDSRIPTALCYDSTQGGALRLKPLLPQAVQDALGDADITIPPYMLSSAYDGRFGVVFIQADEAAYDAPATVELEIGQLIGQEMNVALGLPRLPQATADAADPERLLNQDVAAYAPDNEDLPTVDGFEATPITIGWHNPMLGGMRGFSAIIYGLQHDVFPASPRNLSGVGIPTGDVNVTGALPACSIQYNGAVYTPSTDPRRYFLNLIACLLQEEERLLTEVIEPRGVFTNASFASLQTALNQVKDKLLKALSGAGPNTGSETFQAVLSQLTQFDALVTGTPLAPGADAFGYSVYKNELLVRSQVLRFNVVERALPSIPVGGF
jgi:hypothetical protein